MLLWLIVLIALICAIARCQSQTLTSLYCLYDQSQISQVKEIAAYRAANKLPPLHVVINPNDGPSTSDLRKPFLAIKNTVLIGYVPTEARTALEIRSDLQTWHAAKVPMIFLDDTHAWDIKAEADKLSTTVWIAIQGTGYTTDKIILNPGGPVKASAWMRQKSWLVCDFEDPVSRLKDASTGPVWLAFVRNDAEAQKVIATARKRKVRFIGFDRYSSWKVPGEEWQTTLPSDLVARLKTLQ